MPDKPLSVGEFIKKVNRVLASHSNRIIGEITSVSKYPYGYFFKIKDKDDNALLNCLIWDADYRTNGVEIKEGSEVIVGGTPEIFAPNGRFTFMTKTIEYAGEGALKKAYEQLKKKLGEEGIFDTEKKRKIPDYPRKIGLITSRSGAVVHDFNTNLGRYGYKIEFVDSRVEGKDSVHELLSAIETLRLRDIEVLVIIRGGGSWESLQAFNTESVVRAVSNFPKPVITGIGHDVDVTLVELAADVGVSTPTAVPHVLNKTWDSLLQKLEYAQVKIVQSYRNNMTETIGLFSARSRELIQFFEHEVAYVKDSSNETSRKTYQFFKNLERVIVEASGSINRVSGILRNQINTQVKLLQNVPVKLAMLVKDDIEAINANLLIDTGRIMEKESLSLRQFANSLELTTKTIKSYDPRSNMRLGYSISFSSNKLLRSTSQIKEHDIIRTLLSDGQFTSEVKKIE